eukprot:3701072-Pleurochrysis_carterae.AAC.1
MQAALRTVSFASVHWQPDPTPQRWPIRASCACRSTGTHLERSPIPGFDTELESVGTKVSRFSKWSGCRGYSTHDEDRVLPGPFCTSVSYLGVFHTQDNSAPGAAMLPAYIKLSKVIACFVHAEKYFSRGWCRCDASARAVSRRKGAVTTVRNL